MIIIPNSVWGSGDRITLDALRKRRITGFWLNLGSGDGRYSNLVLSKAKKVIAADFEDNTFDGILCTGTLHLFSKKVNKQAVQEITRILKPKGSLIIDFATETSRRAKTGEKIAFGEKGYNQKEAENFLKKVLKNYQIKIQKGTVRNETVKYKKMSYLLNCNFFLITGKKN